MAIHVDDTGYQRHGDNTWLDPATGDQFTLEYFDQVPNLPAPLDELTRLRHELTVQTAPMGGLVEAFVVTVDSVPALLQVVKLPLPDRPGQGFVATLTVPKATCSAQLKFQAVEGPMTGVREAVLVAELGPKGYFGEHPYAPEVRGKLPWHRADDPQWDPRFPDHPLTRARHWLRRMLGTARLDPGFAALPAFTGPPLPVGSVQTSVLPGIPIAGYLPLWLEDRVMFWRMDEPDVVLRALGTGDVARAQLASNNFREAVLLGDDGRTLTLPGRFAGENGDVPAVMTTVSPVGEPEASAAATSEAVAEAFRWVGRAAAAAALRGDYLAVDPGSPTGADVEPYCTIVLQHHDDETHATIETSPVPAGAPFWSDEDPVNPRSQTKGRRVDVSDEDEVVTQFSALGLLAMFATSTWQMHPLRLCLSYGRNLPVAQPSAG